MAGSLQHQGKDKLGKDVWRLQVFLRKETLDDGRSRPRYHRETFHGSRRDADKKLAELVAKHARGAMGTGSETFGEVLDQWVAMFADRWSPTTLRTNRQVIESTIRPSLGHIKVAKLTARDLDMLYDERRKRGNGASTVRRTHALIRKALEQARLWDLVPENVADRASPDKVGRTPVEAPTTAEVEAFTLECDRAGQAWLGAFLRLEALTGMRRGEMCALRWSDVILDGDWATATSGVIQVERSLYAKEGGGWGTKAPKTKRGRRVIPLLNGALDILRWHREDVIRRIEKPDEYVPPITQLLRPVPEDGFIFSPDVFHWERPYKPDSVSKAARRIALSCGIKITPHQLRHWAATELLAAGIPASTVATILGHADASITLRVYDSGADLERVTEAIGALSLTARPALPA
jgi:integrase